MSYNQLLSLAAGQLVLNVERGEGDAREGFRADLLARH